MSLGDIAISFYPLWNITMAESKDYIKVKLYDTCIPAYIVRKLNIVPRISIDVVTCKDKRLYTVTLNLLL